MRMKAVAINPLDWKQLASGIMVEEWPAVLGIDGAGVVEAVGSGGESLLFFCHFLFQENAFRWCFDLTTLLSSRISPPSKQLKAEKY